MENLGLFTAKLIVGELRSKGKLNVIPFADVTAKQPAELQFPQLADIADLMSVSYTHLDPVDVEKKINEKTRAIIFVGYGGRVGQLDKIIEICKKRCV